MSTDVLNTLLLSVFLAAAAGGGYYVTQRVQPTELESVEADIEALRAREAEVETLIAAEAEASESASATLSQWNTRYKVLPSELPSADIVSYLNALSARGFNRFDLSLTGLTPGPAASYYTYQVTGEAYFESLFAFMWHLENGRGLYRVRDLSIKKRVTTVGGSAESPGRQVILAEFAFAVDAFFSANIDISAPDSAVVPPPAAYPARRAAINPFFPYILDTLPDNVDDLVDPESDQLVSVIGRTAVFERGDQLRELRPGDRVYLGRIGAVDPARALVTIDYNRGGIRERVEIGLDTGERYRQALGRQTFSPSRSSVPAGPTLDTPPPAPGTPEALEAGTYRAADVTPRTPSND